VEIGEGQRPLVRIRRRWEGNIKIDIQEMGLKGGGVGWVDLDQDEDSWRDVVTR
jgi:hypothetical protein